MQPLPKAGKRKLCLFLNNSFIIVIYGPHCEKTYLRVVANNTGADQPAHLCSLIRAFAIHFLESIKRKLDSSEIRIFQLVSVAEETNLKLALSETSKTGFLAMRSI